LKFRTVTPMGNEQDEQNDVGMSHGEHISEAGSSMRALQYNPRIGKQQNPLMRSGPAFL
jgi:hypothetical protein